jgi:xanthine dehydrogenase accessory factor
MSDIYKKVEELIQQGETVAVATIVSAQGSVPREVGAKMLIRRSGEFDGTVGGGCGEADVFRAAMDVIDNKEPQMVRVDLTDEIAMKTEAVCGGHFDIFVEPWYLAEKQQAAG